ncbi:MAG: Re/Si-specific NAD(P)(+) transhydrogenase subunit alpha [Verrucomicrobia bacterium]|nr:Re/Si-specific NAD(P)(+) transhydrogenase subunit alpha [Verrucomicrobiota bacterium]
MRVGIPKEIGANETRVAVTPETTAKMVKVGFSVSVESGAGSISSYSDKEFVSAGAKIESDAASLYAASDVVLKVRKPAPEEINLLKSGSILVAFLQPFSDPGLVKALTEKKITAFSMDLVPRISRAQKLDALSSQSNVAGYKSVILAANTLGTMMPLMMTAAGTVTPAKVFVIGAGVAGLQAIATARRLGAVVEAFDTRPVVQEQVESLGAKFVSHKAAGGEDKKGYATELSADEQRIESELLAKHVKGADIVITTAQVPGKPAPRLITEEMVQAMKHGSVIVDLAAEAGGNCALTQVGKEVIHGGVRILGPLNLAGQMPRQSSQLYARNIFYFLMEMAKEGNVTIDLANPVLKESLVTKDGQINLPSLNK